MVILVVGSPENYNEMLAKFGQNHELSHTEDLSDITEEVFFNTEVVFDFINHESPENLEFYNQKPEIIVFVHMALTSFHEIAVFTSDIPNLLFGFNGFPTFGSRSVLEFTMSDEKSKDKLQEIADKLGTDFEIVDDRVGMVTPRIIFMIINEAYFTVQEGTASKADIDLGMKLGTNYPFGPFEWSKLIGLENVVELLEAVYDDTKDERYKICPLLKKEYLSELALD
jgi:3-hydroxybutyryl-CoA dehydrogenase